MSFLTPEQQERLDAAAAEAALRRSLYPDPPSPSAEHPLKPGQGKPHTKNKKKHGAVSSVVDQPRSAELSLSGQPGTGCSWGSVYDSLLTPVFALNEQDPNFEAELGAILSALRFSVTASH